MILSIDALKVFDKVQHSFFTKTLSKLRIIHDKNIPQLENFIYQKLMANTI